MLIMRRINDNYEYSRVDWKFIYTGDCWIDMGAGYFGVMMIISMLNKTIKELTK